VGFEKDESGVVPGFLPFRASARGDDLIRVSRPAGLLVRGGAGCGAEAHRLGMVPWKEKDAGVVVVGCVVVVESWPNPDLKDGFPLTFPWD